MLDSFCSISGELTLLGRVMKGDKAPPLRNQLVLPLMLSQEPDENLGVSVNLVFKKVPLAGYEENT